LFHQACHEVLFEVKRLYLLPDLLFI